MGKYLIDETTLSSIGDAIRAKTGNSATMTPAEMVTAIQSIQGGDSNVDSFANQDTFRFIVDMSGFGTAAFTAKLGMTWADWCESEYNTSESETGLKIYIDSNGEVYETAASVYYNYHTPSRALKGTDLIMTNSQHEIIQFYTADGAIWYAPSTYTFEEFINYGLGGDTWSLEGDDVIYVDLYGGVRGIGFSPSDTIPSRGIIVSLM